MANITETVTSTADLITKLNTWLVGQGWTSDQLDTAGGKWAVSKTGIGDDVYVSVRWDTANPTIFGIYNATAFVNTSTDPGNHTGDSGNGAVSGSFATLATGRYVACGAPIRYWAFADSHYVHVVIERTTTAVERQFVHFGFGVLSKIGDWTGGAYAYGFRQETPGGQVAVVPSTTILLDGLADSTSVGNFQNFVATLRIGSGFPNQAASQWAVVQGNNATLGTDRAGNARNRVVGGFRAGPLARAFARFQTTNQKGLMPGYPILVWYWNTTNGEVQPLGWQDDVRGVNIEFYAPADEITVGSDTWILFPSFSKDPTGSGSSACTGYQGIAYRKF